jgi:type IX secretion system PorP/SprF family membrane protein
MKKKLLVISLLTTIFVGDLVSQQNKVLTHFVFDKMSINPGATGIGMRDGFCGTTVYRNQWDRVNGAPNSALLNVEGNLSRYFNGGFGLSFYHDAIGFSRQNNVVLTYSYHLPLGNGILGIGASAGLVSYGMQPDWVTPQPGLNDPNLPIGVTEANLDANFGVYYMSYDGWYAGVSATHLPAMRLEQLNFETARHYYAMGGYRQKEMFGINELDFDYNVLVRTELVKFSADFNARAIYNFNPTINGWGGLTYRIDDAIGIMAGIEYNNFAIGYSYDFTVNALSNISWGSHEILLRYCHFLPPVPITRSRNPRYL